jgi:hypothetical protein
MAVSRRPPISLSSIVARAEGYAYDARVWDCPSFKGSFAVAPYLTQVAPLLKGNKNWENYYFGFIPLGVFIIITAVLVKKEILTWKDPLGAMVPQASAAQA